MRGGREFPEALEKAHEVGLNSGKRPSPTPFASSLPSQQVPSYHHTSFPYVHTSMTFPSSLKVKGKRSQENQEVNTSSDNKIWSQAVTTKIEDTVWSRHSLSLGRGRAWGFRWHWLNHVPVCVCLMTESAHPQPSPFLLQRKPSVHQEISPQLISNYILPYSLGPPPAQVTNSHQLPKT